MGFRLGGLAGYGLRRLLVDQSGVAKCVLQFGQHKSIATDRIVLLPGPPEEVKVVKQIFSAFVHQHKLEREIASMLNKRGISNCYGRPWHRESIKYVLQNEKYIGNNVWNRHSFKLQKLRIRNSPEEWLRSDGVFQAIVDQRLFDAAQAIYKERKRHPIWGHGRGLSDRELLGALKRLLRRRGYISRTIIDSSKSVPGSTTFIKRFGSLRRAYELIEFNPEKRAHIPPFGKRRPRFSDNEMLEKLRKLFHQRGRLSRTIIDEAPGVPCPNTYASRFGGLTGTYKLLGLPTEKWQTPGRRPPGLSEDKMLEALRKLWRERETLSQRLLNSDQTVPSYHAYRARFGGLEQAYRAVGFKPKHHRPLN